MACVGVGRAGFSLGSILRGSMSLLRSLPGCGAQEEALLINQGRLSVDLKCGLESGPCHTCSFLSAAVSSAGRRGEVGELHKEGGGKDGERDRGCRKSMSRDGQRPPNSGKVKSPTNTYTDLALCDLGGAGVSLCPNSTKGRTCSLKLVFPPSRTIIDMLVCRNHVQL